MTLQRSIQKPVKIIRPISNAMLKRGCMVFSVSSTFKNNARFKLAKKLAKAKQHPGVKNHFSSSSTLSSKNENEKYNKRIGQIISPKYRHRYTRM